MWKITVKSLIILAFIGSNANAQTVELLDDEARSELVSVNVQRGNPSPVIFRNGEIIDAIKMGDMSENVYSFNAPIDSGQATTLNINQIQELEIPGATKANNPIIDVETLDSSGERRHYSFIIYNNSSQRSKIFINPAPEPPPEPEPLPPPVVTTIETSYGSASPIDVELGLEVGIREEKVNPSGNLAIALREYIAQTQNGTSAKDALENTSLPFSAVQEIAELGQIEDTRIRLSPLEADFKNF